MATLKELKVFLCDAWQVMLGAAEDWIVDCQLTIFRQYIPGIYHVYIQYMHVFHLKKPAPLEIGTQKNSLMTCQ